MRCKYLGNTIKRTCCSQKSTYECDRLDLPVIPLAHCEDCRFWNDIEDKDTDVSLPEQLQAVFDSVKPQERYSTGGGDGIVYVGEGKYWPGIAVGIHMIQRMGCELPVEVWFRGKSGTVNAKDVEACGNVSFIDLDELSRKLGDSKIPQGNPKKGGWEAKLYAAMHTRFDRYLYLDADAYVVNDPTPLFNTLDRHCFTYWRDLPTQVKTVKWQQVYPHGETIHIPPIQGGQLLVDRNYGWRLIHLANFICQNSHHYFRYMYGDQDAWRVALAMEFTRGQEFPHLYKCLGNATWKNPAFICGFNPKLECHDDSKPVIVHRCQGKLFPLKDIPHGKVKYSNPQYFLPRETEVFNVFAQVMNGSGVTAGRAFTDIYSQKLWGGTSGRGSEQKEAQLYIDTVNGLIRQKGWKTVVDCGSGDGNIASQLKCEQYVGYDCCFDVVRECQKKFPFYTFVHLDILKNCDIIQCGDVLLCKDVLHHWPNEWVETWLKCLTESRKWKCILLTQDNEQLSENQDCHVGGYRALNYKMKPLSGFKLTRLAGIYHKDMLMWEYNG